MESRAKGTILIVDDMSMIRTPVRRFIERRGYEVVEAMSGRDALEQLRQRPFDALLLDLSMPEADGYGVLDALRGRDAPPTIVFSSELTSERRVDVIARGAFDALDKGRLRLSALVGRLERAIAEDRESRGSDDRRAVAVDVEDTPRTPGAERVERASWGGGGDAPSGDGDVFDARRLAALTRWEVAALVVRCAERALAWTAGGGLLEEEEEAPLRRVIALARASCLVGALAPETATACRRVERAGCCSHPAAPCVARAAGFVVTAATARRREDVVEAAACVLGALAGVLPGHSERALSADLAWLAGRRVRTGPVPADFFERPL